MMPLVVAWAFAATDAELAIIPAPARLERRAGADPFEFKPSVTIAAPRELDLQVEQLRRYLRPAAGLKAKGAKSEKIELKLDPSLERLGPEGYRLESKSGLLRISARSPAGVFYGIQTLRQLLHPSLFGNPPGRECSIPALTIEDTPRFRWRGAHMDVARHFMPKKFILKFLDLMALHKLNMLHWHLVDDHGWRIEIKRYPKLTQVGAQTDFSSMIPELATRPASVPAGGYYTQEDVREIVRYAAERHIRVIPEIELPGHSLAAIRSYPEVGNGTPGWDNVYNVEPATFEFLKGVLDEVLELFPSEYIHIGGDEVDKAPWKNSLSAQAKMRELGLKTEAELQSWFIRQIDAYLDSKGRTLVGWDEILEGGLAEGAVVMSWRGFQGGIDAAMAGHNVVMTPTSHAYLDYGQWPFADEEPRSFGGYISIERVYEFEPIPTELSHEESGHVLGAQANLWSEYIPTPEHMEYMAFPRLCAMAEVVWSMPNNRSWEGFRNRLGVHLQRLDALKVNYRKPRDEPQPIGVWKSGETSEEVRPREWSVSVPSAGNYDAVFVYTAGAHRLDIQRVELLEDGRAIVVDEHLGSAGFEQRANRYRLAVPTLRRGAVYRLRAFVRSDGGADSAGNVYFLPSRP